MHPSKIASTALSIGFGIAALGSLCATPASATVIDPSTLHIGNGVTGTCPTGGCPIFNQNLTGGGTAEVNSFTSQLDLYQNTSGQSASLTAPLLMIFAVPNGTSTSMSASSLSTAKYFDPYNAASGTPITFTFGTTAFSLNGSGFEGFMTDGEIYAFLANIAADPDQK